MFFQKETKNPYRPKKTNWISPRLIATALIVASLGLILFYAPIQNRTATTPFQKVVMAPVTFLQTIRSFGANSYQRLAANFASREEVERLRAEVKDLNQENTQLRFKLQRHEAYISALRLPREVEYQTLAAIVVFRDFRLTHDIIVNRGTADGLTVNMPVWTDEGLVGRTRRVSQNYSKVQILTDPGSAIGVYVENTPYEGILRGSEDGGLVLEDLHLTGIGDEIKPPLPGQEVRTSGTGMVFPRGLLAGRIAYATSSQGVLVEPVVNANSVQSVLIFTNTGYREEILSLLLGE
ncbi:MAG: hypothetical protein GC154_20515 [bacterium]|nr:hypothetical protein [bacterium]